MKDDNPEQELNAAYFRNALSEIGKRDGTVPLQEKLNSLILLIDDDRQLVWMLKKFLEGAGFSVITAADGTEGLDMIYRRNPNCIVCDFVMNVKNGVHVCRQIRARGIDTPFIFLTANITHESQLEGFRAGADDYVTKPFDPRILIEKIHVFLRRSQKGG